jgi:hypothetical protein
VGGEKILYNAFPKGHIRENSMQQGTENLIYQKASKCWESVNTSLEMFKTLLKDEGDFDTARYYKARNLLRDAEGYLKDVFKNAKKLLGPVPAYTPGDYQKWRDELLEEFQILAMSQEFEALKSELLRDDFLRRWMDEESIESLLKKHFQPQQSGKRKLPNIKVRIILDRLESLINDVKEMNKQAILKQQS